MKIAKYVLIVLLTNVVLLACSDGFGETDFINLSVASTDVSATFDVAQDNSGEVTITPMATGVVLYKVYFGDNTTEPAEVKIGNSVRHTYAEGSYQVKIVAVNAIGRETEAILPLEVSFKAPENLKVIITNDLSVSKKINVTATADFATTADVYFGETANEIPNTVTIGETISHIYSQTGTYTITVEVKGAGKKTTKYEQKVTVVALQQPTLVAPKPPIRTSQDVISIFSGLYSNLLGTNYNPDWGQGSQGSSFANFTLNDDEILQLIKLSYQGIQFEKGIDVSAMEYLHLDVWTTDVTSLEISLISLTNGEKPVAKDLTADNWTSIDIPLSDFTNQGLTISDIHQLKFVGKPWAKGTVFIDNIYFYKKSEVSNSTMVEDFEGIAPVFTSFGNIPNVEIVTNPNVNGNSTTKVAKMIRSKGSETWAGAFFETPNLDMKTYKKLKMKILSPKKGIVVKVKLENADGSITHEVDAHNSKTNAWEDLTFDFNKIPSAMYTKLVVFFDFGNAGDENVYHYDEIILTN